MPVQKVIACRKKVFSFLDHIVPRRFDIVVACSPLVPTIAWQASDKLVSSIQLCGFLRML